MTIVPWDTLGRGCSAFELIESCGAAVVVSVSSGVSEVGDALDLE
jgi:hypothetical protein